MSKTALVVDDETALLRLMTKVLERAGYQVFAASTSEEARHRLADCADALDVVLLDVLMPDGQGAEILLPEILARRPDVQVVVTSGDQLPASLTTELDRVAGHFLQKPFAPTGLLALLERLPSRACAEDDSSASSDSGPAGGTR